MGSEPLSISPLEQFLTTEPADESSTQEADAPTIDLENICALRERSIRKFLRTLDEIASRYDGDGDEEADDVIDLEHLAVIEDRGYILTRFSNSVGPSSSPKGKARADGKLGIFEIFDPVALDGDDEWVEDEQDEDADDGQSEAHSGSGEDTNGDDGGDGSTREDYSSHHSDSSSIILLPSSSSSSREIPLEEKTTSRRRLDHPHSTCSSSTVSYPSVDPTPQRPITTVSYLDNHTITNALFERLKKRIQERSSDINRHKLYKQSVHCPQASKNDPPIFSSPNSSSITCSSLSSVLTPTEYMISPYLQRLLHPDSSTGHFTRTNSRLKYSDLPVNVTPHGRSRIEGLDSDCISSVHEQEQVSTIRKKRTRDTRDLESTPDLGTPNNPPNSSGQRAPSTCRRSTRHQNLISQSGSSSTRSSSIDHCKPAFLFRNSPLQLAHPSDKNPNPISTPVCRPSKKHKLSHSLRDQVPPLDTSLEQPEEYHFSRESSEDPLYLPPSHSKKSKLKS